MKKANRTPGYEKARDIKKTIKQLALYAKRHLPALGLAVVLALAATVLALMGPNQLKNITNLITHGLATGVDMRAVAATGLMLVLLYATGALLSLLQGNIMASITQSIMRRMRSDIAAKANRLPMWYFNKTTTGDILSRITNDVDSLGQNLTQSVTTIATSLTMFVGALVMMFATNWVLAATSILASLLGVLAMALIMGKSQKYFAGQQQYLGSINGHIEETFSAHTMVRASNGEEQMRQTFSGINQGLQRSTFMAQFLSGLLIPLITLVDRLGYVAVCVVGAALALSGHISFGVIVAFLVYVKYFTQPLMQLAQTAQGLQVAAAAGKRVFEFLNAEEMEDEEKKLEVCTSTAGRVEFRNVRFGYEDGDRTIIQNFSMTAQPGQKVAIVGPTGAGKTTLVNLLMRYNEPSGGTILIDGMSIRALKREALRDLFCMVLQDTWLFEGTVRENIVFNKAGVSSREVEDACRAVGLHHYIQTLPHGYDTVLDDTVGLSAGQKQQLTIARAMVKDAPMLILDEATSSVDTRTEQHIQAAMDKLMEGRTSFVIAHRLSTIRNADIILVLREGDIVESGRHEELLAKGGFYAELYNSQFEAAANIA